MPKVKEILIKRKWGEELKSACLSDAKEEEDSEIILTKNQYSLMIAELWRIVRTFKKRRNQQGNIEIWFWKN